MAESVILKLEDIYTVESEHEDDGAVVEDVAELKSQVESVRDVPVEGNSGSVNGTRDADGSHSYTSISSSCSDAEKEEETLEENDCVYEVVENVGGDEASKESYNGSSQPSADVVPPPPVESINSANQPEEPEPGKSTGISPNLYVSARTMQPTSWKSCCGLFDVLRRSDK